jgi:hypothetical protein
MLQELNAEVGVTEEEGEEQLRRKIVCTQGRAPIHRGMNKSHGI